MSSARHRPKSVTRRGFTLLAALLLADGAWVRRVDLMAGLFPRPMESTALSWLLESVDRFVAPVVERRQPLGYRLAALPPDEHLGAMLACVPTVKRSAWWRRFEDERLDITA